MNKLFDLTGRLALITGSSRGIGRAIAEGYAAAGARVVINGRDAAAVAATVKAVGGNAVAAPFDVTKKNTVEAAVAQIEKDLRVLSNRRAGEAARAEALRFLIHFVADVHQPLHAEDHDDKGGNQVRVTIGRYRANLHRVWDSEVVDALGADPAIEANVLARSITPAQRKSWASGAPAQWANEAHAIARDQIYPPLAGRREVRLPRDYAFRQAPVTRLLLAKAGVRLAFVLNNAFK